MRIILILFFLFTFVGPGLPKESLPDWVRGAVWYHILPERFRNINPQNDPVRQQIVGKKVNDWQVHPWASDWYKLQVWEKQRNLGFPQLLADRRYGGDLIGVIEKLPYLKDLGVDVIYLNPVFESPSIEKYDATTLHHIDNNFGLAREEDWKIITSENEEPKKWTFTKADEVFFDLINQAHDLEMKVVIEAVFNYCSTRFWAFKDVETKQQHSEYKEWFEVLNWDDPVTPDTVEFSYKCWRDDKRLPLFRRDSTGNLIEPIRKYVFNISRRWMDQNGDGETNDGIDGWSIRDVSGLPGEFWHEWNSIISDINANALTISDYRPGKEDGPELYKFKMYFDNSLAVIMKNFFNPVGLVDKPVANFVAELKKISSGQNKDLLNSRIVQLSNLKTDRVGTFIANKKPEESFASTGSSGFRPDYNPVRPDSVHRKIQQLLTLFQLTFPGAPMIYYGDESGMWGGGYPDNIKPMLWREFVYERESYQTIRSDLSVKSENKFDRILFDIYRRMNRVRKKNPALIKGKYRTHIVDNERKILVYSRKYQQNEVYVFMNLSNKKQNVKYKPGWRKNKKVKDPFDREKYKLKSFEINLDLKPLSARVLIKE